ncbi:MAG: helix-turn-helix transcriptional regulator [Sporomusaceae bacterium]|nr:helix-turn-helix transcriptional regulator [Sporomusaceae bacterium]
MTLGEKVRRLREKAGLTTEELARRLGVSQSYISHVENNRRLLGRDRLVALAKTMNIPVEFFLREDVCSVEDLLSAANPGNILASSPYANYLVILDKALAAEISPQELEQAVDFIRKYKNKPQ